MNHRLRFSFLNIAHFACHYFLLIFPTAVIAIEREGNLDFASALSLATPMYVVFALATLPAGWLGDRGFRQLLMVVFFIGCGASALVVGFSSSNTGVMVGLAGLGLFAAIYHPVGLAMVTESGSRTGHLLAVNGVYGNLGLAAAALLTGIASNSIGWRYGFLIPGVVAVVVGFCWLVAERSSSRNENRADNVTATVESPDPLVRVSSLQSRIVLVVLFAAIFSGFVFNGTTISLPKVFEQKLSTLTSDLSAIGSWVAMVYTIAAFAQLPVGALLDRFGGRNVLIVLFVLQSAALAIASQLVGVAVVPATLIAVTFMFAGIPITGWLLGRYVSSKWRSRAFAAEYVLSLGMSALAVPLIAWLVRNDIGFDRQYLMFAVSAAVVVLIGFLIPVDRGQYVKRTV